MVAVVVALGVWLCGIAVGIGTLLLVHRDPLGSLAGSSVAGGAGLLIAGWLAIAVGLLVRRRRRTPFATLLVLAGFAWFVTEWNSPGADWSLVFTAGLVFGAVCPALVAHAALAYPGGRLASRPERYASVVAYVGSVGLLGLAPALVFDPAEQGCRQCANNLVAVSSNPDLRRWLDRAGLRIGVGWALALVVLAAWRVARSTPAARRLKTPVLLAAVGYLGAVAISYIHLLDADGVFNDTFGRRVWLVQATALTILALGVAAEAVRARRARSAVAAMVVELAHAPVPGGLRDALAGRLGDPDLEIVYPLEDGRNVDGLGIVIDERANRDNRRATTALVRDSETIALLVHRDDLLGDARLVVEVASAAGVAFENERLQAAARAQLAELRTSQARLVAASDRERQQLERDLHDGAQQRLVGLTLALRLTRAHLGPNLNPTLDAPIAAAEAELALAVDDLRDLASGIHPAVLTDLGLAAALRALAEAGAAPLRVLAVPDERLSSAIETAAYLVVADSARLGATTAMITRHPDTLVVEVDAVAVPERFADVADRVGALDGSVEITPGFGGGVHIRAAIPCG
jgi:signal transduction histidine kinase